jgi:hypothetical protein
MGAIYSGVGRGAHAENLYDSALTDAKRTLAIQNEFRISHPYVGANAGTYVEKLKRESFRCQMQYRTRTWVDRDQPLALKTTPEAGIQCFNEKYRRPNCPTLRVGISLDWDDRGATLIDLKAKLSVSNVTDAVFVCEGGFTSEERRAVQNGIKGGYVVPI